MAGRGIGAPGAPCGWHPDAMSAEDRSTSKDEARAAAAPGGILST
jgi:hypothetical protein